MPRELSEDHKAAMQAGRKASAEAKATATAKRKDEFRVWSKASARAYLVWLENCGKLCEEPCEWCETHRALMSAIPDMRDVEGEKE